MCQETKQEIGYITPFFLELNPIELVFGFCNHRVRVPVDINSATAMISFLDQAPLSKIQQEVASCIACVEEQIFPLVQNNQKSGDVRSGVLEGHWYDKPFPIVRISTNSSKKSLL
ncbi:MAG: hypothetical protein EZS28_019732 [Streblomastix strix]|uniref:Uncharacterized protein n=1 Tax=Streblomastix strix TaxID=222440 RepID=A0A5J4VQH3_9EUKA|nr:MAG: hypothetical protein EZS28_019732 [Streblomastix strix]